MLTRRQKKAIQRVGGGPEFLEEFRTRLNHANALRVEISALMEAHMEELEYLFRSEMRRRQMWAESNRAVLASMAQDLKRAVETRSRR